MHIIYRITYLPHLDTEYPKFYIGSKFNWKGKYYGSVASKSKFPFTNNKTLKQWWKLETSINPDLFIFEIIETHEHFSSLELVQREREIQLALNVARDGEYFNQCVAMKGFVSQTKSAETKDLLSQSTKLYWESEAGIAKKARLSERNRQTKPEQMKTLWQSPTEAMVNRVVCGRTKGAKDKQQRKKRAERGVSVGNTSFPDAKAASVKFNVTPTTIRFRCRNNLNTSEGSWRYL